MNLSLETLEQDLIKLGPGETSARAVAEGQTEVVDGCLTLAERRLQSEVAVAEAALTVCEQLGPQLRRPDAVPRAQYLRARLAVNNGRLDDALRLIDDAQAGWFALDRHIEAYRTNLGRMHVLDDLGRHSEAAETGEQLIVQLSLLDESTGSDESAAAQISWLRAAVRENLGAAYGFTGQHLEALAAYKKAEEEYEQVGDVGDVARCRGNRGVELVAIGRALDGLEAIAEAARMFSDLDDHHSYAKCLGHWAEAELLLGRYTDCLSRFADARGIFEDLDARTEAARLAVKTMRAYMALNLDDEAANIGGEAEKALAGAGLVHDLAEAQWLLAGTYLRNGRQDQALLKLDEAITGAVASDDLPLRARILITRSQAYSDLGRADEARHAAREALDTLHGGTWPGEEWSVHLRLGQVMSGSDQAAHLDKARVLADELGLPHLRYAVLLELGRHHRSNGDDDEARRLFEGAVEVVEGLRGRITDEAVRTSFLEGRTAAYSELIAIMISGSYATDRLLAFDLAEASKARTLADLVSGSAHHHPARLAAARVNHQADLDACYSALITGGPGMTRARREAVQRRAVELETALSRSQLERDHNGARLLDRPDIGSTPPRPGSDEQVVEYHVLDDSLVAFVWSEGELDIVTDLPTVTEARRLIGKWERQRQRYQIAKHTIDDGHDALTDGANAVLQKIWATLFAPVDVLLNDGGRLLIVPHGPTYAVPFHALPTPNGRVGNRWIVSLAPSYVIADRLDVRNRHRSWSVDSSLVVGVADSAAPGVAVESLIVADQLSGSDLLLGDGATVSAVRIAADQPRDVVHVACHGIHRAQNPMFSALKLADGWMTANDVLSLEFNGSLVVLSACESGRHNFERTLSEPVGLARSFLAAGAGAVIVSLWLADDAVTVELMTDFYRNLNLGAAPDEALQRAQLNVEKTHPHPAAWAPFVVHGGSQPERDR